MQSEAPITTPSLIGTQAKVYNSIAQLTLSTFIECCVEGDLSSLTISGTPSPGELQFAWERIIEEYSASMGDAEARMYWELNKEVALLAVNYNLVTLWVQILSHVYSQEIGDDLNRILSTNFEFKEENRAGELARCLNRAKSFNVNHEIKSARLQALKQQQESGKEKHEVGREYFENILITLSEHAKYEIPKTITVHSFCERIKRWNRYCEQ